MLIKLMKHISFSPAWGLRMFKGFNVDPEADKTRKL